MEISSRLSSDGRVVTISIQGPFDFNSHKVFRDAYKQYPSDLHYIVDLNQTTRLDSSALGMLLLLHDHAGGDRSRLTIRGCQSEIREVLNVSRFERLFNIE